MAVEIREDARCLKCGYRLQGLPNAVCPECGRAFAPHDPTTFDDDYRKLRRTRKRRRVLSAIACFLVAAALFPQGTFKAQLKMHCSLCGYEMEAVRWELRPPNWIPFRYPGWTRSTTTQNPNGNDCVRHQFDASMSAQCARGVGKLSASTSRSNGDGERQFDTIINGVIVTSESAADVLKVVMWPSTCGVTIGKQLVEP
ncbi:MAG: hypothetical protein HY287_04495 [Planctomycetes bacterium]|nr:hypothetical protein [Planctomycetota bacterium]MBI3833573.1 hypothetical protein [Planctomycetota bacterium]